MHEIEAHIAAKLCEISNVDFETKSSNQTVLY